MLLRWETGETPMSIVTLDWPRIDAETPSAKRAEKRSASGRNGVFRSALEIYIADYERHLATTVAERDRRERLIQRTLFA
jgi:hypothetical protein